MNIKNDNQIIGKIEQIEDIKFYIAPGYKFNLTNLYGPGKEPTSEQIDKLLNNNLGGLK